MNAVYSSFLAVHITLQDLLPDTTYFRFNPNLSIDATLDESKPEVLEQLKTDAKNYINKYEWKYRKAAESLKRKKTTGQYATEQLILKLEMRNYR